LSAISIAESFAPEGNLKLDPELDELFRQELSRLEQKHSGSTKWSQLFEQSRENLFLFDILRVGYNFTKLRDKYPDLLSEALLRNSERLSEAHAEWGEFTREKYLSNGLGVPAYPHFVQIQEALGLYGRFKLERTLRRIKRSIQHHYCVLFDRVKAWLSKS